MLKIAIRIEGMKKVISRKAIKSSKARLVTHIKDLSSAKTPTDAGHVITTRVMTEVVRIVVDQHPVQN